MASNTHPGDAHRLEEYWVHGKGAVAIKWGVPGDFDRCVRHLEKYFPQNPQALCSNLHMKATGVRPGQHGKSSTP